MMSRKSFLKELCDGSVTGEVVCSFVFATLWFTDKISDQDEQNEEIFSRLKDCEEKNMPKIMN